MWEENQEEDNLNEILNNESNDNDNRTNSVY